MYLKEPTFDLCTIECAFFNDNNHHTHTDTLVNVCHFWNGGHLSYAILLQQKSFFGDATKNYRSKKRNLLLFFLNKVCDVETLEFFANNFLLSFFAFCILVDLFFTPQIQVSFTHLRRQRNKSRLTVWLYRWDR